MPLKLQVSNMCLQDNLADCADCGGLVLLDKPVPKTRYNATDGVVSQDPGLSGGVGGGVVAVRCQGSGFVRINQCLQLTCYLCNFSMLLQCSQANKVRHGKRHGRTDTMATFYSNMM